MAYGTNRGPWVACCDDGINQNYSWAPDYGYIGAAGASVPALVPCGTATFTAVSRTTAPIAVHVVPRGTMPEGSDGSGSDWDNPADGLDTVGKDGVQGDSQAAVSIIGHADVYDCVFTNCRYTCRVGNNEQETMLVRTTFRNGRRWPLRIFGGARGIVTNCVFEANRGSTDNDCSVFHVENPGTKVTVYDTVFRNNRSTGKCASPSRHLDGTLEFVRCLFEGNTTAGSSALAATSTSSSAFRRRCCCCGSRGDAGSLR